MKPVRVTEEVFKTIDPNKYVMEKKYDGFRALLIMNGSPKLWTRDKNRIELPNNLVDQLNALNLPEGTVLDGEIWNPLKRGSWRHDRGVKCQLTFWDVIRVGYKDMSQLPLEERKKILDNLVLGKCEDIGSVEQLPASLEGYRKIAEEAELHKEATGLRSGFIHGAVLKRKGSPRRDHAVRCAEHSDWMKLVLWPQN